MSREISRKVIRRLLEVSAVFLLSGMSLLHACEPNLPPGASARADEFIKEGKAWKAYGAMNIGASKGSGGAYRYLATMLEKGRGVERSAFAARQLNWMGSQYHDADAMFHAAKDFYARGHRNDGDDLAERAFQCGHPEAALLLAERRAIEGKASEALRFLTLAIEASLPRAKYFLAEAYDKGSLGLPKDYERAFYWYSLAAKDGIAEAKSAMAYYFVRGLHGQQDDLAALHWYHEAAKGGHVDSMTAYGWMLMTGKGTLVDIGEASYYLRLAAKNGDKQAAKFLKEIKMKPDGRIQISASPALKND